MILNINSFEKQEKELTVGENLVRPSALSNPQDQESLSKRSTGTSNIDWAAKILGPCFDAACRSGNRDEGEYESALAFLSEFHPKDVTEGLLVSKIVALHFRGMYLLANAQGDISNECKAIYVNMATKLLRLENETIEALTRYRNRGAQKYVVQHVNVEGGGRAIVGAVWPGVGGEKNGGATS